jgi:ABC-type phosphate transport system auxiliary subunit
MTDIVDRLLSYAHPNSFVGDALRQELQAAANEIKRLREQCKGLAQAAMNNGQDLLLHEHKVEQLQADNERLRDLAFGRYVTIERLRTALHWTAQNCLDHACVRRAIDILEPEPRAALEGKP